MSKKLFLAMSLVSVVGFTSHIETSYASSLNKRFAGEWILESEHVKDYIIGAINIVNLNSNSFDYYWKYNVSDERKFEHEGKAFISNGDGTKAVFTDEQGCTLTFNLRNKNIELNGSKGCIDAYGAVIDFGGIYRPSVAKGSKEKVSGTYTAINKDQITFYKDGKFQDITKGSDGVRRKDSGTWSLYEENQVHLLWNGGFRVGCAIVSEKKLICSDVVYNRYEGKIQTTQTTQTTQTKTNNEPYFTSRLGANMVNTIWKNCNYVSFNTYKNKARITPLRNMKISGNKYHLDMKCISSNKCVQTIIVDDQGEVLEVTSRSNRTIVSNDPVLAEKILTISRLRCPNGS